MATGQGGYSTNGILIATRAQVGPDQLVSVDTQSPNGSNPQTLAVALGLIGGTMEVSAASIAITALAGGGQANATQLFEGINVVTVVATATDSVKLPAATAGAVVFVKNADAADSMTVFGFGTDTIDGVASATGNPQAAGKGKLYYATTGIGDGVAGTWVSLLGA